MADLACTNNSQLIPTALKQGATGFISENVKLGGERSAGPAFYQSVHMILVLAAPIGLSVSLSASVPADHLLGEPVSAILFQVLAFDIVFTAGALPMLMGTMLRLQKFKETALIGFVSKLVSQ